ncbi:MAG: hypothetical protein V1907_01825 [Candidatus Kerfeldbacteria bacterium]
MDKGTQTIQGIDGQPVDMTDADLATPEMLRLFQRYIIHLMTGGDAQQAYQLVRGLDRLLKKQPEIMQRISEYSRGYGDIMNIAKGLALSMLTNDEIMEYLRKGIIVSLRNPDVSLLDAISTAVDRQYYVEDMDDFKQKLTHALFENHERLTLQSLQTGHGTVPPTVHDWLQVAQQYAGDIGRPLAYAVQDDDNFKQLQQGEQEIVLKLMGVYDLLSVPSSAPEGFDINLTVVGTDGKRYVIEGGDVRPAVDPVTEKLYEQFTGTKTGAQAPSTASAQTVAAPSIAPVKALVPDAVKGYRELVKKVGDDHRDEDESRYSAQEELIKESRNDISHVISKLANGLAVGDRDAIIVSLFVLTRFGVLDAAMKDVRIRLEFDGEFIAALAKQSNISEDTAISLADHNTNAPTTVAAFLYWALDKAMAGDETESARIGNQIGNQIAALGKPEYVRMTYFDIKTNSFRWTPIALKKDGSLLWVE